MKKVFWPFILSLLVIILIFGGYSLAKDRPPIDFTDRPLKLWVPYDPKNPGNIDNMQHNFIFIDKKDLQEIEDAKNPTKTKSDDPPVNYQMSSATYYANIKDDYINISGVYNISKLDDEWTLIPVISDQVAISSSKLNDQPAFMTTFNSGQDLSKFKNASQVSRGYYYLALKEKGIHRLKVDLSTKLLKDPSVNTKSFNFLLPNIPIVSLHCVVNQKNLDFTVPNATSIASKNVDEGSKLFASFPPVNQIEVKWNPKSTIITEKDDDKTKLPPSITAVTYNKIELGRGTLKGRYTVNIDIRHAAVNHFDFFIPEEVEIDSITANNNVEVIDPSPEVNKDGILPVDLTSPVEGNLSLVINYRKNFDGTSFITKIPAITLANKNIDRETGFVGIAETTNIETNITETDENKNYTEIDSKELTGPLSGMNASIAFKYQKNKSNVVDSPYDITIDVIRHEDVAVYEATINSLVINSVMNEDGQVFSKAVFQIRNTRKQFLEVTLPDKADIWSVYVDNKSVKPALLDKEKNIYSIPLSKSSDSEAGGKAFPVEIVYFVDKKFNLKNQTLKLIEKPLNIIKGSLGFTSIKAISAELDSNSVKWRIYLPHKKDFLPVELLSNLQKVEKPHKRHKSISTINAVMQEPAQIEYEENMIMSDELASSEMQQKAKLDMELKRSPAPAPPPMSSRVSDSYYDYKIKGRDIQQFQGKMPFKTKKVGKLPIYVDLPRVGKVYDFYQISFQANNMPSIFTFYGNKKLITIINIAVIIVLIAFLIASGRQKEFKTPKFIIPAVLLASLLFYIFKWSLLWLIIFLGIVVAILFGLYRLSKWIMQLEKARRNKAIGISVVILLFLLLVFISLLLGSIKLCFGILLFIILLSIAAGSIYLIYKVVQSKRSSLKKDPPEEQNIAHTESQDNMEGHNND